MESCCEEIIKAQTCYSWPICKEKKGDSLVSNLVVDVREPSVWLIRQVMKMLLLGIRIKISGQREIEDILLTTYLARHFKGENV
jgi:hypothetical protein